MQEKIIEALERGKKCILLHVNADPDALGCAFALKEAFSDVSIFAAEGLSKNAKFLQKKLSIEVFEGLNPESCDSVIIVDCASPERLGNYQHEIKDPIVIDHHPKNMKWEAAMYLSDESRSSCAEIVYSILKGAKKKITWEIGLSLCAGILTDSGKFSFADAKTLRIFANILDESGVTMEEVISLYSGDHETDYSRRISVLKGAQRLKFQETSGLIVAQTQIGAFESNVSSALLILGADCAFAGSQRKEEFRISARAKPDTVKQGVHLGRLLEDIGSEMQCDGGGHDGAAGLVGIGDVEAMLNICLNRVITLIKTLPNPKNTGN